MQTAFAVGENLFDLINIQQYAYQGRNEPDGTGPSTLSVCASVCLFRAYVTLV